MKAAAVPASKDWLHRFAAHDREAAANVLNSTYGSSVNAEFSGTSVDFRFSFTVAKFNTVALASSTVSDFNCTRETGPLVQIVIPLRGVLNQRSGTHSREIIADPAIGAIVRPWQRTVQRALEGTGLVLTLPMDRLVARAEVVTGQTYGSQLISEMVPCLDLSAPIAAALVRNMKAAMSEIQRVESIGLAPLLRTSYEELFLNLAIAALFPSIARTLEKAPPDCNSAAIRQARDYIVAHACEPIDLAQLAGRLGLSMRAMQVNFRKNFGLSPRDFIMECRLDVARQLLQAPDGMANVTQAAFASGFVNLGHFASKYRCKYGELPCQTKRLNRTRLF
ncbi:MAG: AraC family transcriptional regulator [Hyphomicrobium sp.]